MTHSTRPLRHPFFAAVMLLSLPAAALAQDRPELPIGSNAPLTDVPLATTDGDTLTLAGVAGQNGLLVVFTSNTCPWVHRWESRYLDVAALAEQNGIGMIALNPNEATRADGESMLDMRRRAADHGYTFPYALDRDHRLATAYGANRTPHLFLFDADGVLVYRGAIDDNAHDPEEVTETYALDAIRQLAAGESIAVPTSASLGCTIKWLTD